MLVIKKQRYPYNFCGPEADGISSRVYTSVFVSSSLTRPTFGEIMKNHPPKSDFQLKRERTQKQKEKFICVVGYIIIPAIVILGVIGLIWINKL
tara:strand:- start:459 stop:740 length:282 start_codon:yes stop_codon:yes gene_type:complete